MGTSDIFNPLPLGAQCLWEAFCENHSFWRPPFGIPVLIAPVIPGNKNVGH